MMPTEPLAVYMEHRREPLEQAKKLELADSLADYMAAIMQNNSDMKREDTRASMRTISPKAKRLPEREQWRKLVRARFGPENILWRSTRAMWRPECIAWQRGMYILRQLER